jgi:uncharacterized protein YecT (DUF1311 family)
VNRRKIAGAYVVWFSFMLSPALAQDTPELLAEDQAGMEQCLNSATGRGARAEECLGFVQDPCMETDEGQSTAGSVACAAREHAFWDKLLNQSYQNLRDSLDDAGKSSLRDVQRQWLAWRQARCAFEAQQYEGGTFANVAANTCFTSETARRAIDLTQMLPEGGSFRLEE